MKAVLLGALLIVAPVAAQPAPSLDWLSGDWRSAADGRWTEEHWSSQVDGTLLGYGRSGRGERQRSFEFMRVARDAEGVALFAQPGGAPAVRFVLTESGAQSATFTNAAHDYPQRIAYRRTGDILDAETSKLDGSSVQRWRYRLVTTR